MEIAPAGENVSFEVTYDAANLYVAMSVFDTTGVTPTLVSGPAAMVNITGTNTYSGKFTPVAPKSYAIVKSVYTDNTFTTLRTDYASGSESIFALNQSASSGPVSIVSVIGFVNDALNLVGFVNC